VSARHSHKHLAGIKVHCADRLYAEKKKQGISLLGISRSLTRLKYITREGILFRCDARKVTMSHVASLSACYVPNYVLTVAARLCFGSSKLLCFCMRRVMIVSGTVCVWMDLEYSQEAQRKALRFNLPNDSRQK